MKKVKVLFKTLIKIGIVALLIECFMFDNRLIFGLLLSIFCAICISEV